jgi:copper oxidase (laccase) domain-containing protein
VRQVHGGTVLYADAPGCRGEADALWTDRPGLGTVGRRADCPLVLVMLPGPRPCWGFAHASWRSAVRGITGALVAAMADAGGDPAGGSAIVCPSAGPCCYEVGDEVRDEALARLGPVAGNCFAPDGGRWLMDLWRLARGQLRSAGLPADGIHLAGACTLCTTDYPSHRRQGAGADRFAAVIAG